MPRIRNAFKIRAADMPVMDTAQFLQLYSPLLLGQLQKDDLSIAPNQATYNAGGRTIAFVANVNPGSPCAKCILKLRGWDEEVLPCAWNHPDLF